MCVCACVLSHCAAAYLLSNTLTQQDKQVLDNSDIEQQIRKTLSRQHAKDISDYTRKIASKDREIIELKRKLSKVMERKGREGVRERREEEREGRGGRKGGSKGHIYEGERDVGGKE